MGEPSEEAWKAAANAVAAKYAEHADAAMKLAQEWERRCLALRDRAQKADASKAALIADIEEWMSDSLLELPHDAIDLDRILDKHRGQP